MSTAELIAAQKIDEAFLASDTAARAELWISFVSLMRSNLAALTTLGMLAEVSLIQTSATSFSVNDLSTTLSVSISLENGDGTYRVDRSGSKSTIGAWHLGMHATVSIDQGPVEDMEIGLEALAAKLWKQEQPLARLPEEEHL